MQGSAAVDSDNFARMEALSARLSHSSPCPFLTPTQNIAENLEEEKTQENFHRKEKVASVEDEEGTLEDVYRKEAQKIRQQIWSWLQKTELALDHL